MEKIILLLALCVACALAAADYKLVNDSTSNPGITAAAPILARTSILTQPAPLSPKKADDIDAPLDNNYASAHFYGNSFVLRNIRVQNDSVPIAARKRLDPSLHYVIQNQTIAMDGQEYLIRPRGYRRFDIGAGKRAMAGGDQPPNGKFYVPEYSHLASQVLTVTPDWAAFRVTNSSGTGQISFFDSETINSLGATFTLYAGNPSGMPWFGPGSFGYNVSDRTQATSMSDPSGIGQLTLMVPVHTLGGDPRRPTRTARAIGPSMYRRVLSPFTTLRRMTSSSRIPSAAPRTLTT
jgi:hypothetical protein